MAEVKKNKDGLEGGKLVSAKDHARIIRAKQKAAREAAVKKAK